MSFRFFFVLAGLLTFTSSSFAGDTNPDLCYKAVECPTELMSSATPTEEEKEKYGNSIEKQYWCYNPTGVAGKVFGHSKPVPGTGVPKSAKKKETYPTTDGYCGTEEIRYYKPMNDGGSALLVATTPLAATCGDTTIIDFSDCGETGGL